MSMINSCACGRVLLLMAIAWQDPDPTNDCITKTSGLRLAELASQKVDAGAIGWICFAREGAILVSSHLDGRLRLWSVPTMEPVANYEAQNGLSHAGRALGTDLLVTGGLDGLVRVFDLRLGKDVGTAAAHDGMGVLDLAISTDRTGFVSVGAHGRIIAWEHSPLSQVFTIEHIRSRRLNCVAYASADTVVVGGAFSKAYVYDLRSRQLVQSIECGFGPVQSCAVVGDRVAIGSGDGNLYTYDRKSFVPSDTLVKHGTGISGTAACADGIHLASADRSGLICVWNAQSGTLLNCVVTDSHVTGMEWSKNGKYIASAHWDGTVRMWGVDGAERVDAEQQSVKSGSESKSEE